MVVRRRRDELSTRRSEGEVFLRIQVNGEPQDVEDGTTLFELISSLKLKPEQIAVELNRTVVRRAEWSARVLSDGDTLEIVQFVGGGGSCNHTKQLNRAPPVIIFAWRQL